MRDIKLLNKYFHHNQSQDFLLPAPTRNELANIKAVMGQSCLATARAAVTTGSQTGEKGGA